MKSRAALVLVMLVLLPACLQGPPKGVSVKALAADLVFGIPPLDENVGPPSIDTTPEDPFPVLDVGEFDFPSFDPPDFGGPIEPTEECPDSSGAFPDRAAPTVVDVLPKTGTYKWRYNGVQTIPGLGDRPLVEIQKRKITDVTGDVTTSFTFTIEAKEQLLGDTDTIISTYRVVVSDPLTASGVYLSRIERRQGTETTGVFEPVPAVLMLPMPTQPGLAIDSTGFDPANGSVLRLTGSVTRRHRVEACGEVADAWFVDGTMEFTDPQGEFNSQNYDYAIASALGGIVGFEFIEAPPTDPVIAYESWIGQLDPDPLT